MILSLQNILVLLLGATFICSRADDTCPDVKLTEFRESDKMTILKGHPGIPGYPGLQGPPGLQGHKGDLGSPGNTGDKGLTGKKGDKGAVGQMGIIGKKGDHGVLGITGDRGLTGQKGTQGSQGSKGDKGPTGDKGDLGSQGTTGDGGPTGLKGDQGALGRTGDRGLTGEKGSKGEKGYSYSAMFGGQSGLTVRKGAKNCKELRERSVVFSGWYTIYPDDMQPLMVRCDMVSDGGGWIVFQRRVDGSIDFYQNWETYKRGFGSQLTEFWLGNENIHRLTSRGNFQLRVDLEDFDNNRTYATYREFSLSGEKDFYKLNLGSFIEGTAGDSFYYHRTDKFSTYDRDNDQATDAHCAEKYKGGYWYFRCRESNLNGLYLRGSRPTDSKDYNGVSWKSFRGDYYSLRMTEMKFRPNT
ncbi:ficolin-1-B-like [Ranitomeya imitator]|uniref:ficolin-1-B-like n=1 Tax=Ranitomeya imitator TaxID=111125 RepID=UPI0037E77C95